MDSDYFVGVAQQALWVVALATVPVLIPALVVGVIMGMIQAATSIQEQTLQYTAKFFAIVLTLFATAALLGGSLYQFGDRIFTEFPALVRR